MSALDVGLPRDEFVALLRSLLSIPAAVYGSMPGTLHESPVVLVLDAGVTRAFQGVGSAIYDNVVYLEAHILAADAGQNPSMSEQDVDDLVADIEKEIADAVRMNQRGTYWRALRYGSERTPRMRITYLDGNPYQVQIINLEMEAPDVAI